MLARYAAIAPASILGLSGGVPSIYSSARTKLDYSSVCQHHAGMISSFVRALISAFKARRELALENVALRQQLAVLRRSVKRPRLSKADRGFWVLLRRIWTDWESVLVIVKPETVIRWHRCGFRRYWGCGLNQSCGSDSCEATSLRKSSSCARLCLLLIHPRAPNLISLQSAGIMPA